MNRGRNEGIRYLLVALFVVGLFLPYQSLRAATAFTETWEPTEYRVAYLTLSDIMPNPAGVAPQSLDDNRPFCLGPSKWDVTTVIDGQTLNETWTAANWVDTQDAFGLSNIGWRRDGVSIRYGFDTTCENNSGFHFATTFNYTYQQCNPRGCVTRGHTNTSTAIQLHPTGLYGGLISLFTTGDNTINRGLWLYKSGVRSIPTKWQITGNVVTP